MALLQISEYEIRSVDFLCIFWIQLLAVDCVRLRSPHTIYTSRPTFNEIRVIDRSVCLCAPKVKPVFMYWVFYRTKWFGEDMKLINEKQKKRFFFFIHLKDELFYLFARARCMQFGEFLLECEKNTKHVSQFNQLLLS